MALRLSRIEHVDAALVEDLLASEADEWQRRLHWDREPLRQVNARLAAQRRLPGWLAMVDGVAAAKVLLGTRRRTRSLEFPYVAPAFRGRGQMAALLGEALDALQPDRRVGRVEVGFFPFDEAAPSCLEKSHDLRPLPRQYMMRDLSQGSTPEVTPLPSVVSLVPWAASSGLSRLLHASHRDTPDRQAVDLYATRSGCALYLDALAGSAACGLFAPDLSTRAVDSRGRVIGFLLATRIQPRTAHVAQIAVHPDWQGQGLGTALMDRYAARARAAGAASSTLLVTEANARARAWYARRGYCDTARFLCYWWEPSGRPIR